MESRKTKLILEFTEFNAQRLNPDSAQMSIQVDNPQLSINAFDKHEDAIRAGVARINNILHTLSNSSSYRSLKSKLSLESQNIENVKILRIVKRNDVYYDAYLSFVIGEMEYFGVVKNLLGQNTEFQSEVFKDQLLLQAVEWQIKIKGLIIKTIKRWLEPEYGDYKLLNDELICYSVDSGKMIRLSKGAPIEVVKTYEDQILIKINNELFTLKGDNFIYFNWWFEKVT
jgi:hypothetical protein